MKAGDLVKNLGNKNGDLGLFLRWRTFDKSSNPYTCPEVWWSRDNRIGTIQASLLELVSESR